MARSCRSWSRSWDISERKRLALELERQARTDSVTGMLNRRGFLEAAVQEVNRCKRYGRPLSVLFVDLDHFDFTLPLTFTQHHWLGRLVWNRHAHQRVFVS